MRTQIQFFLFLFGLLVAPTGGFASPGNISGAHVTEVYPTSNILPENLLRFYIYFSKPMQKKNSLEAISLRDSEGEKVEGAFLENKYALWSPDAKRLTLLFDPGRVKSGLVAHQQMGRALQPGKHYTLVIDKTLLEENGEPLTAVYSKPFRVSKIDFEAPDTTKWQLATPESGTQEALSVRTNGIQDHVSLAYRIRVHNESNNIVQGRVTLSEQERCWKFTPARPWQPEIYTLVVDPMLEDIVGNRMTGLFEKPFAKDKKGFREPRTIRFQPLARNSTVSANNDR